MRARCWPVFQVGGKKEWGNEVKLRFTCIGESHVINSFGSLSVCEQLRIYPFPNQTINLTCYQLTKQE